MARARPLVGPMSGCATGRVVAIGELDEQAARTVDADGLVVAPGFIDPHTHFDAAVSWDPALTPSPLHGVTTVLAGNCGFTIAPLSDAAAEYVCEMLSVVEGMPLNALQAGCDWVGRSFQGIRRRPRQPPGDQRRIQRRPLDPAADGDGRGRRRRPGHRRADRHDGCPRSSSPRRGGPRLHHLDRRRPQRRHGKTRALPPCQPGRDGRARLPPCATTRERASASPRRWGHSPARRWTCSRRCRSEVTAA